MKKIFKVVLAIIFLVGFTLQTADCSVKIADGSIEIGGYAENLTGVRLADGWGGEAGDLSMSRFTLQLQGKWKMTDDLHFNGIMRAYKEASYNLDGNVDKAPYELDSGPDGTPMSNDVEMREYYLDYYATDHLKIRVGRQQIIWGESDALRLADIINPLDMSWEWVFASWEDIRIPQRMIRATYDIPSENNFFVEMVYNLEDFRANTVAPAHANWSVPNLPQVILDQMDSTLKNLQNEGVFHDDAGGLRIGGVFGGWDVKAYYYHQRAQDSVYKFDMASASEYPETGLPLAFEWPYIDTVGATFNVYNDFTEAVFRGEVGYVIGQPFIANPLLTPMGPVPLEIKDKDVAQFMVGFDRPTMIKWLNPTKSFFISGQFFQKFILDMDDDDQIISTGLGKEGNDDNQSVVTLLINTEYWDSKLKPEILVAHDLTGNNGFFKAKIAYEPNYTVQFTLGYLGVWGTSDLSGFFGPMRNNDEIFGKLRISF